MGQKEHDLAQVYLAGLQPNQRRARINAGRGWVASPDQTVHVHKPMTVKVYPGDIILHQGRPFYGAPIGTPDYVGFDSVVITAPMVGQTVSIFAADELKTPGVQLSRFQRIFQMMMARMGGRFREIR
jgi:hypothetical protein